VSVRLVLVSGVALIEPIIPIGLSVFWTVLVVSDAYFLFLVPASYRKPASESKLLIKINELQKLMATLRVNAWGWVLR